MIEHFYERIPGYFTFPDFYAHVADVVPPRAHLVEVGVYAGQSAAYLGVELLRRGKGTARLDLVDMFHGGKETVVEALKPIRDVLGSVHAGCSWELASAYADRSLDFVFIDADHGYESVRRDIDAWLPKVKAGGILAGHDYTMELPGVIRAVNETFDRIEIWRGIKHGGDAAMHGKYWPVWCVRIGGAS